MADPAKGSKQINELILAFLSGAQTRNNFTTDQWNTMLQYAARLTNPDKDPAAVISGTQPVVLFQNALVSVGAGKEFKKAFSQGVQAGVWAQDQSSQFGYVYNTLKYGQPGSGAAGEGSAYESTATIQSGAQVPAAGAGVTGTPKRPGSPSAGGVSQYTLQNLLMGYQIPMDQNLQSLIHKAVSNGWSTSQFLNTLYDTPEFHQSFPGIFNKDGTLRMSPQQYIANTQAYKDAAAKYGINLNDQKTAFLFRNEVSPSEFADRAQAVTMLRTNQQYLDAFNQQLKRMGEQPLTKQEQFKFVMGEGNQKWYDLYNRANTGYAAEQAGIAFGKAQESYTSLSQKTVKEVAGKNLTMDQLQTGFAKLAQDLQTTLPMSKIQKFNITKQDLVELEFGGPHQAAIARKVQQVLANEKMFTTNQVSQRTGGQFTQGTRGETGETGGY